MAHSGGDPRLVAEKDDLACAGQRLKNGDEAPSSLFIQAEERVIKKEGRVRGMGVDTQKGQVPDEHRQISCPVTYLRQTPFPLSFREFEAQTVSWVPANVNIPFGCDLGEKSARLCLDSRQQ